MLLLRLIVAACAGHDWASPADLMRAIAGDRRCAAGCCSTGGCRAWSPRLSSARCSGWAARSIQGVFRNPLAEPYLLGSAGGAALGATVALLVPFALPQSWLLPLLAFAGAWGATMLVIGISRVAGAVDAAGTAAGRRRGRGHPGRAALVPDARSVGRDGEPAGRAELGAGRRADADLARVGGWC